MIKKEKSLDFAARGTARILAISSLVSSNLKASTNFLDLMESAASFSTKCSATAYTCQTKQPTTIIALENRQKSSVLTFTNFFPNRLGLITGSHRPSRGLLWVPKSATTTLFGESSRTDNAEDPASAKGSPGRSLDWHGQSMRARRTVRKLRGCAR